MLELSGTLQFEVVRCDFAALPILVQSSSRFRKSLLGALGQKRQLTFSPDDAYLALAELLGKELGEESCVNVIRIGERSFCLEELLSTSSLSGPLSQAEALLLAPWLRRHCHQLERVQTSGSSYLNVRALRQVSVGAEVAWSRFAEGGLRQRPDAETPMHDAECILAAGLIEVVPEWRLIDRVPQGVKSGWALCTSWSPKLAEMEVAVTRPAPAGATLSMGTWRLGPEAMAALQVARRRCDLHVRDISSFQRVARRSSDSSSCWQWCCLVFPFVFFMLMLRCCEDSYAREMGYGGALLSQHPLKSTTFAERLKYKYDLLAAPPASGEALPRELNLEL